MSEEFREVYDAHWPFVWRSLRRLGVPESDAADAAQEVFLVIHRKLPTFEGRAKITTWIFRICMRVASDRGRRAHVRREVFEETGTPDRGDPADGPQQMMERLEDVRLFDAALERMSLDQRAVFTLFELEAMTGEEIAEALELPLGTVYSRLRAAREAFRSAVKAAAADRLQARRAS